MEYWHQAWTKSKIFRIILVVTVIYALLRLAAHGALVIDALQSGNFKDYDLQVYLDASSRLLAKQDLYPRGQINWIEFYQYSPAYALAYVPFLWIPIEATVIIQSLLHLIAYGLLYRQWGLIFKHVSHSRANEMLAWTLPVWLAFSQFWADLGYFNVYILMALFATLLIGSIIKEQLGPAVLWLSLILPIKPQWAFACVLPLLLGRYRFFIKLLISTMVVYLGIAGVTIVMVEPAYGWKQYLDYFNLLQGISGGNYAWRDATAPFLGYNHSIVQIVFYLFGISTTNLVLATAIKTLLLIPLALISLRCLLKPYGQVQAPLLSLDLAFALYLGIFIWMNVVWEVTLGIAIFTYLLGTLERQSTRLLTWAIFLPYALVDWWQLTSYIIWGENIIVPGPYILTDPSIYIPLVMIVIIVFYALVVKRLWDTTIMSLSKTSKGQLID